MAFRPFGPHLLLGLVLLGWPALAAGQTAETARFEVLPDVVAEDVAPFTATIGQVGNGHRLSGGGGFEPTILRTVLRPTASARDRIVAPPREISHYDILREGALDGAEVEVLRIVNGAFVSVRRDRVAAGGHRASGWSAQLGSRVLPATMTSVSVGWAGFNRLEVPYFYTVRAVDATGRLSPTAEAVSAIAPAEPAEPPIPETAERRDLVEAPASLAAPGNLGATLQPDGSLTLAWDPVPGATGYVLYRADTPPEQHRGYSLALEEDGPEIQAGDLVIVRQRFTRPDRERILTNRVWNATQGMKLIRTGLLRTFPVEAGAADWRLQDHPPDTPVEDPGETYLHAEIAPGQRLEIGRHNHASSSQTFYEVLDPARSYRFEAWLRGDPGVTAVFEIRGPLRQLHAPRFPARIPLERTWTKHAFEFRPTQILETGSQVGWMGLSFEGWGEVSVDNLRIYRADAPYMAWLPEDLAALEASGMSQLRTHGFIKTGRRTYDLAQLTNPAGAISTAGGNTLPQTLGAIADARMDPWLQIEPHFSRDELLGLAEFLAAPFDPETGDAEAMPWAAKRARQGQIAPYTDLFGEIRFEIGNETWNGLFEPWTFSGMTDAATGQQYGRGEVYGLYQEYVLSILRDSPHWSALEPKLRPVIGGWSRQGYGFAAARMSPLSPELTHAAYNGGWDVGEGPVAPTPAGFVSILSHAVQAADPLARRYVQDARAVAQQRAAPLALGTYEAGPGYALNGLNRTRVTPEQAALQEAAMKSAAAGTATLDTFLIQARAGFTVQNFFTFERGSYWTSHAPWTAGGQAYPSWQWLTVLNRGGRGPGDMLATRTREVPRRDLPARRRTEPMAAAPMVDVYPLLQDDQLYLVVVSRLVPGVPQGTSGVTDVTISLPYSSARALSRLTMTGGYSTHNLDGPDAILNRTSLDPETALPDLHIPALPPGATEIYVFDEIE